MTTRGLLLSVLALGLSTLPALAADPALLKLEVLEAPQDVKEQIRWRNAAALFADPK